MKTLVKFALIFLVLSLVTAMLPSWMDIEFGQVNYFERHSYLFLLFITLFPRLTLLLSSVPFGGIFWWIGFFFAPRFLVAILATIGYWETNPLLVTFAWVVAWGGESGEKYYAARKFKSRSRSGSFRKSRLSEDAIDIDYKKL